MKLVQAQISLYRNIIDSTTVDVETDVTCFVGKNESGKTSFLQALYRLNPARQNAPFSIPDQYPAWLEKRHIQQGKDLSAVVPVSLVYELEPADRKDIEAKFGVKAFVSNRLALGKTYKGTWTWPKGNPFNEREAVLHFMSRISVTPTAGQILAAATTFEALRKAAAELEAKEKDAPEDAKSGADVGAAIDRVLGEKTATFGNVAWQLLLKRVPKFLYFSDYAKLPYSVNITSLLSAKDEKLTDSELTARSLLRLGGADKDYLLNPDYERRKRELENIANALTYDVLQYWTQNDRLRVLPEITQKSEQKDDGQHAVIDELKIRVWDDRHGLSLPFDQHSTGFQWFFSFLAAFSEHEQSDAPVVILLDEPALGLHAKAQGDFLRFIDERLAKRCQVLYTTHSPFMIQPGRLNRVRIVEDRGRDTGTVVSQEVFTIDSDTLLTLQGALGYDLVQHLAIAPNNLVVEGTSDYAYLIIMSDHLRDQGRVSFDPGRAIVPVGGADLIPTFVALLGNKLDLTVLIDTRKEGNQRLARLAADGYLAKQRIVTIGEITGTTLADIEDLFDVDDYLQLYNTAFSSAVRASDLVGSDQIVSKIARHIGVQRFDHGRPADVLLRRRGEFLDRFSSKTFDNFEALFKKLNATFPPETSDGTRSGIQTAPTGAAARPRSYA